MAGLRTERDRQVETAGRVALGLVATLFLLVTLPVVIRGGPLRDDFDLCTSPRWNSGPARAVTEILPESGAVRLPGRLVQVAVVSTLCERVPFSVLILVPLSLTFVVAGLLWRLLRDLGSPPPWPYLGAALWLLQPLGTESALWAVQFNIPLGLALALASLLLFRRGKLVWGVVAAIAAFGLVEQIIFALPLAVWLLSPPVDRRAAFGWSAAFAVLTLVVYTAWPGFSERTAIGLADRALNLFREPSWYAEYPIINLGLHSIPLAFVWRLPVSALLVVTAGIVGAWWGPRILLSPLVPPPRVATPPWALSVLCLLVLANIPLLTTVPHPSSPRTFTPTWLILAGIAAIIGGRVRWTRPRLGGAIVGVLATGALLSLALSVWVRVQTADFTEASSRWFAERVPEGGSVLVCEVPRTAVTPAPAGDFAVHELVHPWAAEAAVRYYAGREVSITRVGELWPGPCERRADVDAVVRFHQLPSAPRDG